MATHVLPFEQPVTDLSSRIQELRTLDHPLLDSALGLLESTAVDLTQELFAQLTPWQKVQLSRHPARPYTLDYIGTLLDDFVELHGDRLFRDDAAIVGGLATYHGRSVVVVGHQKGRGVKENILRNFGMPHPEGYRKAQRLYELADRFGLPLITLIDTPGAYPGIGAEERGQSEAIGSCLATLSQLRVPVVAVIVGEGGSGGALALGVANRILVLEYGTYSVITPEGCASILWKDGTKAGEAAARLKMTAADLHRLGIVDRVVPEPVGGAHRDPALAAQLLDGVLQETLEELLSLTPQELVEDRYRRFRDLGAYCEGTRVHVSQGRS